MPISREATMNNTTIIRLMLTAAFGIVAAPSANAQSTLGGSKPQQNKIGGVAKPAPTLGGAVVHTPSPPAPKPPAPAVNLASKPGSTGTPTPTTTNALGQAPQPTPPVTTSKKSGAVVTNNMKCSGGACTSVVPKP